MASSALMMLSAISLRPFTAVLSVSFMAFSSVFTVALATVPVMVFKADSAVALKTAASAFMVLSAIFISSFTVALVTVLTASLAVFPAAPRLHGAALAALIAFHVVRAADPSACQTLLCH